MILTKKKQPRITLIYILTDPFSEGQKQVTFRSRKLRNFQTLN